MAARVDPHTCIGEIHGAVLVEHFTRLQTKYVLVVSYGELIRLPREHRHAVCRIAWCAAEDGGKTAVNIVIDGESAEVT